MESLFSNAGIKDRAEEYAKLFVDKGQHTLGDMYQGLVSGTSEGRDPEAKFVVCTHLREAIPCDWSHLISPI